MNTYKFVKTVIKHMSNCIDVYRIGGFLSHINWCHWELSAGDRLPGTCVCKSLKKQRTTVTFPLFHSSISQNNIIILSLRHVQSRAQTSRHTSKILQKVRTTFNIKFFSLTTIVTRTLLSGLFFTMNLFQFYFFIFHSKQKKLQSWFRQSFCFTV